MTRLKAHIYRSFTQENGSGGNTAAIVHNNALTQEQMMDAAQHLDVSETAFIDHFANKTKYGAYRVLYYTRNGSRVPLCGHATLAAGKEIFSDEGFANQGNCPLHYESEDGNETETIIKKEYDGRIFYRHDISPHRKYLDSSDIINSLEVDMSSVDYNFNPIERNHVAFIALTEQGFNALPTQPDSKVLKRILQNADLIGTHIFMLCNAESDLVARTRNFSPVVGIDEENATGSDTAMLTKELLEQDLLPPEKSIEQKYIQGENMNQSFGVLYTQMRKDGIWAGGRVSDDGMKKFNLQ